GAPGLAWAPSARAGSYRRPSAGSAKRSSHRLAAAATRASHRSSAQALRALREGAPQRHTVRDGREERHAIDPRLHQLPTAFLLHPFGGDANPRPRRRVARVHEQALPRLRVFELDPPRVREIVLPRIVDGDRHHFVARGKLREWDLTVGDPELREEDDDCPVPESLRG